MMFARKKNTFSPELGGATAPLLPHLVHLQQSHIVCPCQDVVDVVREYVRYKSTTIEPVEFEPIQTRNQTLANCSMFTVFRPHRLHVVHRCGPVPMHVLT